MPKKKGFGLIPKGFFSSKDKREEKEDKDDKGNRKKWSEETVAEVKEILKERDLTDEEMKYYIEKENKSKRSLATLIYGIKEQQRREKI